MGVVNTIFQNIKSFFDKNDKFLVLEILHHQLRAALIKADLDNKELYVKKVWRAPFDLPTRQDQDIDTSAALIKIKKFLRRIHNLPKYRIILSLDSGLATTVYSSVALVRQSTKEPIDEAELDNLISQAIWKFFDRQRNRVAAKMKIGDLDVLLSDVRIRGVKLDGHKVINPLGFKAKSAEFHLSQTFTPRQFIKELKELLPEDRLVFISEAGAAWSSILSRAEESRTFMLANLFPERTSFFSVEDGKVSYLDHFEWGEQNFKEALGKRLAVSPETAGRIMDVYRENKVSSAFLKKIEKLTTEELSILAKGLEVAAHQSDARFIYLNPFFSLPPVIFSSSFRDKFRWPTRLMTADHDFISQKLGIKVKFKKGTEMGNSFVALAAFLESHFSPQDDKMNRMAKRRVRWLLP